MQRRDAPSFYFALYLFFLSIPLLLPARHLLPPLRPFAAEMNCCVPNGLIVASPLCFCFRARFVLADTLYTLDPARCRHHNRARGRPAPS